VTFLAIAHNGQLDFGSDFNQARLREFLEEREGKQFRIEPVKTTRTLTQNAYYWLSI
jgi:hypothetical protein